MPYGSQTGQPPTPPDVKQQQQGDPAAQMAAQQMAAQQGKKQEPANTGKEFVLQGFQQIAQIMEKQAAVLQTDAPEMMPLFVKAVTALKMVEQNFQKQSQGQGQPVQGSEPQANAEGPQQMGM